MTIGDKVLIQNSGRDSCELGTVQEITKGGNIKLTNGRIFNGKTLDERGRGKWFWSYIEAFSPEKWKKELQRREFVASLQTIDKVVWRNLPLTVLQDVIKIIEKEKAKHEQSVSSTQAAGQSSSNVSSDNAASNSSDQGTTDQST